MFSILLKKMKIANKKTWNFEAKIETLKFFLYYYE